MAVKKGSRVSSNELFATRFRHRGTLSQSDYHDVILWYLLKLIGTTISAWFDTTVSQYHRPIASYPWLWCYRGVMQARIESKNAFQELLRETISASGVKKSSGRNIDEYR